MVTFSCGSGPVTITITSTKMVAQDTTIDGGGLITISGGGTVEVFAVRVATFDVRNLTISNGSADAGGGISSVDGVLTVTNSTITGAAARRRSEWLRECITFRDRRRFAGATRA
jgi:hypothetical protein